MYVTLHKWRPPPPTPGPIKVEAENRNLNWTLMWKNVHTARITDALRSDWYLVIQELLPINDRLYRTALTDTDRCHTGGERDTTAHRVLECGEGRAMWRWTRVRLAMILRTTAGLVSREYALRPTFHYALPNCTEQSYGSWCNSSTSVYNTAPKPHFSTTRNSCIERGGKCIIIHNARNEQGTT
jgi:hypothetical protein